MRHLVTKSQDFFAIVINALNMKAFKSLCSDGQIFLFNINLAQFQFHPVTHMETKKHYFAV